MPRGPEAQLQALIMDWLQANHVLAFRMQTGASVSEYKGKKRMVRYGVPGMADVLAFRVRYRGVDDQGVWCSFTEITPVWIECKAPDGKQSPLQKSFQAQVESHHHKYIVAYSLDDVIEAVRP